MQRMSEAPAPGSPRVSEMGRSPDVVVIGAGVVGAACAYHLAAAGVRVRLLDRSYVASGSSGACEGNVLAWDKELERELPLALRSADLWQRLADRAARRLRVRPQGQRRRRRDRRELRACAERNRVLAGLGVSGEVLDADALRREEPYAAHDLPGGVLYPGDAQLEPRLATAALVRAAVARGAQLATGVVVERIVRGADGRATARRDRDRPDRRRHGRRRRRRLDPGAARDRRPDRPGHAAQGPGRRARALARALPPQAQRGRLRRRRRGRRRRAADRDGRGVHAVRHRAAGLEPPARRLRPRRRDLRRGRDRPPRRALLPGAAATPAPCACTPACAR